LLPFDGSLEQDLVNKRNLQNFEDGTLVNIAAAWGRDPSLPEPNGGSGLNSGTVIPPSSVISVGKGWQLGYDANNDTKVNSGEQVVYTIMTENVGKFLVPGNTLIVYDILPVGVLYLPNTMFYAITNSSDSSKTSIPDNATIHSSSLIPAWADLNLPQN
jgi:uncharacterized repeat protein (TIGR01451 family)